MEDNTQRPKKRVTKKQLRRRRIGGLIVLLIIIFLLSKGCASCINCACKTNDTESEEKSTVTTITDVSTSPSASISTESTLPQEQLVETMPSSHKINVPVIYMEPELPTGSEVTSLAMILKYLDFDVDKTVLASNYMPCAQRGDATFSQAFIGDPASSDGLGCFAPVIVETAQKYLNTQNSGRTVKSLNADSFDDVLLRVASDIPVLVWINSGLELCQEEYCFTLYGPGGGTVAADTTEPPATSIVVLGTTAPDSVSSEEIESETTVIESNEFKQDVYWIPNATCVVLTGYDTINNTVTIIDPQLGETTYDMGMFKTSYNALYKQAVIIY